MANILAMLSVSHVVQGIIVGGVLAFITANIIMNAVVKAMTTTVNGWNTTLKNGQPGNGLLLRAANVAQEAAYRTTTIDSAGGAARTARLSHYGAGLAGTSTGRHVADIHTEQLSARARPRACIQ